MMRPKPRHVSHAPIGELKEKKFGIGSRYAMSHSAQCSSEEKRQILEVARSALGSPPSPLAVTCRDALRSRETGCRERPEGMRERGSEFSFPLSPCPLPRGERGSWWESPPSMG